MTAITFERDSSHIVGDMRQVIAVMRGGNGRAQLVFDMFVHRLRSGIGSMLAALDGADAIVFTAGIGENSPEVRAAACSHFTFLGLDVDTNKRTAVNTDQDISAIGAKVRVLVVRAHEDWAIARECWRLLSNTNHPS